MRQPVRGIAAGLAVLATLAPPASAGQREARQLDRVRHIVVIYEENHSFDNLYGRWPGVRGLRDADPAHTRQVDQAGRPYDCLLQVDVNLTSPPLPADCADAARTFTSHFRNAPFAVDDHIRRTDRTCPRPGASAPDGVRRGSPGALPGGCTRDLVHRYYEERYQLHGGRQDRYVTGSDAAGLAMGHYDTRSLPIYRYLHRRGHPRYAIADRFFQAAFGGSFLNHQWLAAARTPVYRDAPAGLHARLDRNGMPAAYPLYRPQGPVDDRGKPLTQECGTPATQPGHPCGDFAVNTIQPAYEPYAPGTARAKRLPPQAATTIGDRLSARGVSWAWYSGGWSNAAGDVGAPGWTNGSRPAARTASSPRPCRDPDASPAAVWPHCPDRLFQFHHQPLNYYASFAPGTAMRRRHLRDEAELRRLARRSVDGCRLRRVSFVKPSGAENEHPGYASAHAGSDHLVDLLREIRGGACRRRTMIVVTYDEYGGQWDHVPPPGQGGATPGPHDRMGPGTRIPALILTPGLRGRYVVDRRSHDTTSILATIERRFRVAPLHARDRAVRDLSTVFSARPPAR